MSLKYNEMHSESHAKVLMRVVSVVVCAVNTYRVLCRVMFISENTMFFN